MEELIFDYLKSIGLNPFSVLLFNLGDVEMAKISFYIRKDLDKMEDILDYHYSSDRSGLIIFEKTQTILLRRTILNNLIKKVLEWKENDN